MSLSNILKNSYKIKRWCMKKHIILTLAAFAILAFSQEASASISIDKVIVSFKPGQRPVQNIRITNTSSTTIKIKSESVHVINPGFDTAEEEPSKQLSVAPKLFELKAGESRVVRLVLREIPSDLEEIYRVRFIPDKISESKTTNAGGKSVKVDIITAMGVLIMAQPKSPNPELVYERHDGYIDFINKGNVTAHLQRDDICINELKDVCISLAGKRIYPGASWRMPIPQELKNREFTYTLLMNNAYTSLTFPAQ